MRWPFWSVGQPRFLVLDLPLELRQPAVLQLGGLRVVAGALRALDLEAHLLELLLSLRDALDRRPSPAASAPSGGLSLP